MFMYMGYMFLLANIPLFYVNLGSYVGFDGAFGDLIPANPVELCGIHLSIHDTTD
jgi:hypothetical protein